MIAYLILAYYQTRDSFRNTGDDLVISNDKSTITKIWKTQNRFTLHDNYITSTAYGSEWIDCDSDQTAFWTFKYNDNMRIKFGVYLKNNARYGGHRWNAGNCWNSVNLKKDSLVSVQINTTNGDFKCIANAKVMYQCNIYKMDRFVSSTYSGSISINRKVIKCQILLQIVTCLRDVSVTMIDFHT